ncbi:hypothetical protein [Saccharopolyspora hattusasensis]|uniref:hypothetical protein n=1 Tax=Saccharopolyspora hattusasensis TaxID=1128679 RepID=UPI003D98B0A3
MSAAQRAEAIGTTAPDREGVRISWRGTEFTLPRAEAFPLEAMEAEEDGRHLTALRHILGEAQYILWRGIARTAGDAEEFAAQVMAEVGVGNR